jgi:hypothetical protein
LLIFSSYDFKHLGIVQVILLRLVDNLPIAIRFPDHVINPAVYAVERIASSDISYFHFCPPLYSSPAVPNQPKPELPTLKSQFLICHFQPYAPDFHGPVSILPK